MSFGRYWHQRAGHSCGRPKTSSGLFPTQSRFFPGGSGGVGLRNATHSTSPFSILLPHPASGRAGGDFAGGVCGDDDAAVLVMVGEDDGGLAVEAVDDDLAGAVPGLGLQLVGGLHVAGGEEQMGGR